MEDLVIKNGLVVTPQGIVRGGLAVRHEKILQVGSDDSLPKAILEVNAAGNYVLPGLVDPHIHIGRAMAEDFTSQFRTESISAAISGVTTFMGFVRFGEILERRVVPSVPGEAGVDRLIALVEDLHQASREYGLPVRGVGIGAPSIVTFEAGTVVWAPSLGWRNLPLKTRLEDTLHLPVFVENEVNLIALGESWQGAGQGLRNLICISLGAGIGAGIILNGQLYRGSHDAAGEVGYIIPNETCLGRTYDEFGCLESLAGSTGIAGRAGARLANGEPSALNREENIDPSDLTAEMVLSAAKEGDPLAESVLNETLDYLSIAVASLICILDPDCIVISGDLAEYGDLFIEPIRSRLKGAVPHMPDIVLSELRTDAAVLGALAIALYKTDSGVLVRKTQA